MIQRLTNWKTTAAGAIIAAGTYLTTVGGKLPDTGEEWMAFGWAMLMSLFGGVVKDK